MKYTHLFFIIALGIVAFPIALGFNQVAEAQQLPTCTAIHILNQEELETCKQTVSANIEARSQEYKELQDRMSILSAENDLDRLRLRSINRLIGGFPSAQTIEQ